MMRKRNAGEEPVPVVMVHSSASSGRQWRELVELLGSGFDAAAPDLHGYGERANENPPQGFEDDLAMIKAYVEQHDRPVHLVGHSYGGLIAVRTALDLGSRIRSLTLIEPVCFHLLKEAGEHEALAEIKAVRQLQISAVAGGDLVASARGFTDYWMGSGTFEAMPETTRAGIAQVMPKVAAEWPGALGPTTSLADYDDLPTQVLLVRGSQTTLVAKRVADLIMARAKSALFEEIAGAGHMAPITHRDAVNAVLERFLLSV